MKIFNLLRKSILAMSNELVKPVSLSKSENFEEYIQQTIFTRDRYILLHKTSNYEENRNDYLQSSPLPHLHFRCKETNREFYVEVKIQKGIYYQNKMEWCKPYQLKHYRNIDSPKKPVFLLLGLGDDFRRPGKLFLIPMSKIYYCSMYDTFLHKYALHSRKPVLSNYLWKLHTYDD